MGMLKQKISALNVGDSAVFRKRKIYVSPKSGKFYFTKDCLVEKLSDFTSISFTETLKIYGRSETGHLVLLLFCLQLRVQRNRVEAKLKTKKLKESFSNSRNINVSET
ncbi:hypothetical protein CAEBREN_01724 [Caenorhabditis brenneri]|uniref:Uncharacterized protein n=1 Tax=Caenorhabditis brenneri TaxID=135651 RepID=G0N6A2_CAEBE|nr:hypothetical protein CAEBREN_01724 [Caenorhabditis brenneri]